MGELIKQQKVQLIASLIYKDDHFVKRALAVLVRSYGELMPDIYEEDFCWTKYYDEEFGSPLKRKIISFETLISLENIHKVKLFSNRVEARLRVKKKRTVNIDPGYITEAKLILFSTKDHAHRIYVKDRIFAENTLFYNEGTFKPRSWTYPDYSSPDILSYFNHLREVYRVQLRNNGSVNRVS